MQQAQSEIQLRRRGYKPDWENWHKRGFGRELLPVIPHDATLAPGSRVQPEMRGKVPGTRNDDGTWKGLGGSWSEELFPKVKDLKRWLKMGAYIGMQGRRFVGLDIDINSETIARAIQELAFKMLGPAPVRWRKGSSRRLMPYKVADGVVIRKRRVAFREDGDHAVEVLGRGQYYNIEGLHPSGERYRWSEKDFTADNLTEITEEQLNSFMAAVVDYLDMMGYEIKSSKSGSTSADAKPLNTPSLRAPSAAMVLEALSVWKNTEENLPSHDDFVLALRAIKASLGDEAEDYYGEVEQWALSFPGVNDEYVRKTWGSFRDSTVGWSWLASRARKAGFSGEAQHHFDDGLQQGSAISGPETPIERMLARYAWCAPIERYVDMETNTVLSAKAFNAANVDVAEFGRGGINSAEAVFQNNPEAPKVEMVTYRPGQDILIKGKNASGKIVQAVNMWRPSGIVPANNVTDDDVRLWLTHVELIFGPLHEAPARHFLDCVAYKLQHPGVKINHAILLWGEAQGTGKDSVFEPIFRFIGKCNVSYITPETLAGQFTPYLQCEIVVVEEMMNFEKRATANKMKPNLASPPDSVTVNQKHMAPYTIPNTQWWVMFSNYEDAVPIEDTDRRYWVHRCCLEMPRDRAYYDALWTFYDNGGTEKIAGWLLARKVMGRFDPKAPPPLTDAKRDMINLAIPKPLRWLRDLFAEGGMFAGRTVLTVGELVRAADDFNAGAPQGVSPKYAAKALRAEGFSKHDHHRTRINGDVRQLWVRDKSGLLSRLSADQIRERYLLELNRPSMGGGRMPAIDSRSTI